MEQPYRETRPHGTPVFPLQIYSHHDKNGFYFVSQHWHEETEWIYVDNGVLDLTVRGQTFAMHPNSFCFINSGELHELRSSGESYHHAIVFRPNLLDFALYDLCQHDYISPVTNGQLLLPSVDTEFSPLLKNEILHHLQEIVKLYHDQPKCMTLRIKIHLLSVLIALFQAGKMVENHITPKGADSMKKLKEVLNYVEQNFASNISLDALAEISCMTPNYFCHYFRKQIGKSPISFVNEYRIQRAAQMLSETDLQVSQIASAVGFDNFSYFIRKFREHMNVTPKEYRAIWAQQETKLK